MIRTLLLSNSTLPGTEFFTWPRPFVKEFLGNKSKRLVFFPYAAVTLSFDEYASKVKEVFASIGYDVVSAHEVNDPHEALTGAEGIVVGGGNSFALLHRMSEHKLINAVRQQVKAGIPYIGWSAGANLACPTIMTTNDMPIVQLPTLDALNVVPFQINPHYHELKFEGQGGETRKERLEEFLAFNPQRTVLGLPEGMLIERIGDRLLLKGCEPREAKLYRYGQPFKTLSRGDDLSFLLQD